MRDHGYMVRILTSYPQHTLCQEELTTSPKQIMMHLGKYSLRVSLFPKMKNLIISLNLDPITFDFRYFPKYPSQNTLRFLCFPKYPSPLNLPLSNALPFSLFPKIPLPHNSPYPNHSARRHLSKIKVFVSFVSFLRAEGNYPLTSSRIKESA